MHEQLVGDEKYLIGSGLIMIYDRQTNEFKYCCVCRDVGGDKHWKSYPPGRPCPPEGYDGPPCLG